MSTTDPVDSRQRLLTTAEIVFAEKGYDSATVREICHRAGVNIASVSYYFRDKEGLYAECLNFAHTCADDGPHELPHWPPGTTPVRKLIDYIRQMVERMHAPARPSAMRLLMREFAQPSPYAQDAILRFIRPKAFLLRDILAQVLPDADPARLLMTCFSVIGQILFYRQNRPVVELMFGKEQIDALNARLVTQHVTQFTLAALGLEYPS